jgi:hypothetical protein
MANRIRIVHDNDIDRATVTASSASIPVSNLKLTDKSSVWRTTTGVLSASIACAWASAEQISCVSIPQGNFTNTATARVRYTQEASTTQLVPFSEQLTASGWTTTNVTVTANGTLAPDGVSGAAKITGNGVSGVHTISRNLTIVLDQLYTVSLFAKAGTNSWLYLDFSGTGGGYSTFNIGAGQLGGTTTGGITSRSITAVIGAPGWYRISITLTPTTATTTRTISVSTQNVDSGSSTSTTGDAYYWGVNVTPGALTSYYPSDVTFTSRTSSATYINSSGLVATALSGVARDQHYQYPSLSTTAPRLLVENASTNLALYSEDLSNAAYVKGGTTIGTSGVAPDGTTSARLLSDSTVLTAHYIQQSVALTTGTAYTFSTWVKSVSCTRVQIQNGTLGAFAKFNLATGLMVSTGGTGFVSHTISSFPNGWFRISLTFLTNATSSQALVLYMEDSTGSTLYAGGPNTVYNWGWMLEASYIPTSHISTTSASVNRAADVFTSAASTRPTDYMDWWQSYTYDSGFVVISASRDIKIPNLTPTQALSAYNYGGGRALTSYSTAIPVTNMRIDIVDVQNPQGYLEATGLVAGEYFSPTYGAEIGATISMEDLTKSYRSDSGNLKKDVSAKYKKINLDLDVITEANRTPLWEMVSYAGTSNPVWMSVFPADSNPDKEQTYTIYGYFTKATEVAARSSNVYSSKFEVEGL